VSPVALRDWIGAAGGRTFLLTVGCGMVNTILVWFTKITSADFVLVTGATVGAFIAANAYCHKKTVEAASE
jgi:hypothetical protein